tara:strand:- start:1230 stop:1547 length:318 start_codon:yes stop_codon:yes gene_type:complete
VGNSALNIIASKHFITEVGWDKKAYTYLESFGTWFSLGGAFIGGFVASKLGAKRSVVIAGTLIALVWITFSQLESFGLRSGLSGPTCGYSQAFWDSSAFHSSPFS